MEPRITLITLGVGDLQQSIRFYRDGLGWHLSSLSCGDFALFKMTAGTALALYPRQLLAQDACLPDSGGFGGVTLAQNVASPEEVERMLQHAVIAGGSLLKVADKTEWGGYSGYFADPDGHPWEVAWAPFFELRDGLLVIPD
jgi:uncharacterized protein